MSSAKGTVFSPVKVNEGKKSISIGKTEDTENTGMVKKSISVENAGKVKKLNPIENTCVTKETTPIENTDVLKKSTLTGRPVKKRRSTRAESIAAVISLFTAIFLLISMLSSSIVAFATAGGFDDGSGGADGTAASPSANGAATPQLSSSGASALSNSGKLDLDVIFVIDFSGSMRTSDPNRRALSASNLFIDRCERTDSRVGYVMFSHEIIDYLPLTDVQTFSRQIKEAIADSRNRPQGDTDTALGIEKAYELLQQDALNGKSNRRPVVILLSDGNTDIPRPVTRTKDESMAALVDVTQKLANEGVPIYTIGFNYDGRLDVAVMTEIADVTHAITQEVTSATSLLGVVQKVYEHLTDTISNTTNIPATGEPQTVTISVENNSILRSTVTIYSEIPSKDIWLEDPDGNTYDENSLANNITVNKDINGYYTIFTMYGPKKGTWTLHFTGTENDLISIDFLSVYDLAFIMEDPILAPGEATVSWHLEDTAGIKNVDKDLIDTLNVSFHANNDSVEIDFPEGSMQEVFNLAPGEYEAYLTMDSSDIPEMKSSNTKTFTVPDVPTATPTPPPPASPGQPPATPAPTPIPSPTGITFLNKDKTTMVIKLTTIFKPEDSVFIDDFIRYSADNEPLDVDWDYGDWADFADIFYDGRDEIIVTAVKSGLTDLDIIVTGDDGSTAILMLDIRITSGWIYIIIIAVVVLIAVGAAVFFVIKSKPFLDTPMTVFKIEVPGLPDGFDYPKMVDMRLEHVRAKRTLQQIIDYNSQFSPEYNSALGNVRWFLLGTEFIAKKKDCITVTIPVYGGVTVYVNGQYLQRPWAGLLKKTDHISIALALDDYNRYEIEISGSDADASGREILETFGGGFGSGGGIDPGFDFYGTDSGRSGNRPSNDDFTIG